VTLGWILVPRSPHFHVYAKVGVVSQAGLVTGTASSCIIIPTASYSERSDEG
jgi:hypothetical protein